MQDLDSVVNATPTTEAALATTQQGQTDEPGDAVLYREPGQALLMPLDGHRNASAIVSADKTLLLLQHENPFERLTTLARPVHRLAGVRIDGHLWSRTKLPDYASLSLYRLTVRHLHQVQSHSIRAENAVISCCSFSPNSRYLALAVSTDESPFRLRLIDLLQPLPEEFDVLDDELVKPMSSLPLSITLGSTAFQWLPDSTGVLHRSPAFLEQACPRQPRTASGPTVLDASDADQSRLGAGSRTYQDLLQNQHDCQLFHHFCTSKVILARLPAATGERVRALGIAGLILAPVPSPDGRLLLVQRFHEPFSYETQYTRFARSVAIYELLPDDTSRLVHTLANLPLADRVPPVFEACRTGPRSFGWRPDLPATLVWTEAQDGGDPRSKPLHDVRDAVFQLSKPFTNKPTLLWTLQHRFERVDFGRPGQDVMLIQEKWRRTRTSRTWVVLQASSPEQRQGRLLWERSSEDGYGSPGLPVRIRLPSGFLALDVRPAQGDEGLTLLFKGSGATPEGDRPFLDRVNLATSKKTRLWRSSAPWLEHVESVLPNDELLLCRQSLAEPMNWVIAALAPTTPPPENLTTLTQRQHCCPSLRSVHKELVRYQRADGVGLSGYLYLPHENTEGCPVLMWAYPREFKSISFAGQTQGSPFSFPRFDKEPLCFLAQGYAVLDKCTMPIVAEDDVEPNDTYVEQLVANATAHVEFLRSRGLGPSIAIGGHSYGSFMAANLLTHCDLFSAGIARSGAFNRTLTPFGFQKEERTLWEAPEVYFRMSPFINAHQIRAPLLLIHGEDDQNCGTYPLQSKRMFAAIKGLNRAPTRLVLLPHEDHHYLSRESRAHVLWETSRWLRRYLRSDK